MAEQDIPEQDRPEQDDARQITETVPTAETSATSATSQTLEGKDPVDTPTASSAATEHDAGYPPVTGFEGPGPTRRRGPDPLALLVGLATLAMAVFAFVGELPDLPDPRWLLAGGAALVGLVLLVGSLRGRRGPRGG